MKLPRPPPQLPLPKPRNAAEAAAKRAELLAGLPHLYEWEWYQWAWDFFKSTNKVNLLAAANQISKSSTLIRKNIEWAGNPKLWPGLWAKRPSQFWYLYPDAKTATIEFEKKWVPEFMPRGGYKSHKSYGWKPVYGLKRRIEAIEWNSGVTLYFKTYSQDVYNLQSGTCDMISCDEELPENLYSELIARLFATDGYFNMVFTATLNQQFWKEAMEGEGEGERFPEAFKQTVSMYDCIRYKNGKPGAYDEDKIRRIIATCKSPTEVARRVKGRFITEIGRKYPQFSPDRHYRKAFAIPGDWRRYAAVDLGNGGEGHAPGISFIAVRPDLRMGVVYKAWKGDDGVEYTNGDTLSKFIELRGNDMLLQQRYDQASRDFFLIAVRNGETFLPSDKSHTRGEDVINTLFKNDMMFLFDMPEIRKLGNELMGIMRNTPKRFARDDLADAFRYAVVDVPWDWACIEGAPSEVELQEVAQAPITADERRAMEIAERRGEFYDETKGNEGDGWAELRADLEEWDRLAGHG